ncbi:hypothetical protein GCM10029964_079870 [Kibdelosporangium lantanae]
MTTPLFCDTALAARIERTEARLMAECAEAAKRRGTNGFVHLVAGGVATFAEADSPYNKVAGLGFDGVPAAAELDEVEQAFAAHGAPTQVELAHLADPAIGAMLTGRGYRLESFENVLGRALDREYARTVPTGIVIRSSGDDEFDQWLNVMADAVAHPDTQGVPWHEEFPGRSTYAPNVTPRRPAYVVTPPCARTSSPAGPVCGCPTASRSSPAPRRFPRTAATASSPRCCRPGSPTPGPRAATSP